MNRIVKPAQFHGSKPEKIVNSSGLRTSIAYRALEARIAFDGAAVNTAAEVHEASQPVALPQVDSEPAQSPQMPEAGGPERLGDPMPAAADDGLDLLAAGNVALAGSGGGQGGSTIVFVDLNVENVDQLVSAIDPSHEVILIDSSKGGLAQIASYLADRNDVAAIHIISHGEAGTLYLGTDTITNETLASHSASLEAIGRALSADGDILIYGCDVADSADGQLLIDGIAERTGADVAASSDDTGFAEAGGDWVLEHQTGAIETDPLVIDTYRGILAQNNTGAWTVAGTSASFTGAGVTVSVNLTSESPNSSFTAVGNQTLNNIAAFAPAVQNSASLGFNFNWDTTPEAATTAASTDGGTGLVTITFSQAITNPILHLDRFGGFGGSVSNSSLWTLLTSGATLTELAGTSHFDTTATTISRTPNQTLSAGAVSESGTNSAVNTAAGSVRVNGTFTQIQFRLSGIGVEGAGADGVEIAVTYDPVPTAVADTFTTLHDTPVVINVRANDTDPNNDALTVTRVNGAAIPPGGAAVTGGTVTLVGGNLVFTPLANYAGPSSFTYTIADPNGGEATATVTGTVTNARPTVDLDGNPAVAIALTNGGAFSQSSADAGVDRTNSFSFALGAEFFPDTTTSVVRLDSVDNSFRLLVNGTSISSANIEVEGGGNLQAGEILLRFADTSLVQAPWVANSNGLARVEVRLSESGVEFWGTRTTTSTVLEQLFPASGTITPPNFVSGSNTISVVNLNDNGLDAIAGQVSVMSQRTSFATTYTENGTRVSIADTDAVTADVDDVNLESAAITLTNPQTGDRLLVNGSSAAAGTLPSGIAWTRTDTMVTLSGSFTKAQYADAIELVQFENTGEMPTGAHATPRLIRTIVNDGSSDSNAAFTTITIDRMPDPVGDTFTGTEDSPTSGNVLTNDADLGDGGGVLAVVAGPTRGTLTSFNTTTGAFVYTPNANSNGADTFTYRYTDADGDTQIATVTINVNAVNDAPVDGSETNTVTEDVALNVGAAAGLLANSSDIDGNPRMVSGFTIAGETGPFMVGTGFVLAGRGTITVNSDGSYSFVPVANFAGAIPVVTYTVSDSQGGTDTSTLTLVMQPVNDAPVAVDDARNTVEDNPVTIAVRGNDTDVEGDALTVSAVTQGANGTVTIDPATGNPIYTPNANFNGTDTFTYTVRDPSGATSTATVTVTVTPSNDAPVAVDDARNTIEDNPVTIAVRGNDTDVDGDALTVSAVTQGANGTVTIDPATGNPIYTPNANFNGTDTFTYTVRDPSGATSTATVTVTVTPSNDAPVATNDSFTSSEDAPATIVVRGNDNDIDGDTLTVTAVAGVAITAGGPGVPVTGGVVTLNTAGNLVFTPNPNYNGLAVFTYTISDGNGGTDTATVSGTVTPSNDVPVANDDTFTTAEDTPVTINVRGNDTDVDGDPLAVTQVNGTAITAGGPGIAVTGGVVTLTATGNLVFTPNPNFNGTPSFNYTVSDGNGGTDTATVGGTVTPVNDAPVATNDTFTFVEDTSATIPVRTNDSDVDGDMLSVTHVNGTAVTSGGPGVPVTGGVVTLNAAGDLVFTPTANFNGTPSFNYRISDGNGGTATAAVTGIGTAVNDPPVATANTFTTTEDTPILINVLGNDSDPEGDTLTVTHINGAPISAGGSGIAVTGGIVTLAANGTLTFTPNADFNGAPSFTYTIADGNGGTATASVTGTVDAVNDPPVANDDAYATTEDTPITVFPLGNDTDIDGGTLIISEIFANGADSSGTLTLPSGSTVTINANGSLTYTPGSNVTGAETIEYQVEDGAGGQDTGQITFTVTGVNDPPLAVDDTATTSENTNLSVSSGSGLLANDRDLDGNALVVSQVAGAPGNIGLPIAGSGGGTFVVNANGSWTFQPGSAFDGLRPGESASTSIPYQISDGNGGTDTAVLTVTVTGTNDAPVLISPLPDAARLDGQAVMIATSGAFGDVDNATLNYSAAGLPAGLSIDPATGLITGTLARDASVGGPSGNGTYIVSLTASDGAGGFVTDIFAINVTNPPPLSSPLADQMNADAATGISVPTAGAFTDPDADTLTYGATGLPPGLAINPATGLITGNIPRSASVAGPYTVVVTATDAQGASTSTTFDWIVTNPGPAALPNTASTGENQPLSVTAVGGVLSNDSDPDGDTLTVSAVNGSATAIGTSIAGSSGGTFTLNADGSYAFDPGTAFDNLAVGGTRDTFITYTVSDGQGGTATTTLTITVTGANDAPNAQNDTGATGEDTAVAVTVANGLIDTNDTDGDGDTLNVTRVNGSSVNVGAAVLGSNGGSFVVAADGSYSFDPTGAFDDLGAGETATTSIIYEISDSRGGTDTATLTITVTGSNDGPVAVADVGSTDENTVLSVTAAGGVLPNDSDIDGGTLTVLEVDGQQGSVARPVPGSNGGTFTLNGDGSYAFDPGADFDDLAPGATRTSFVDYTVRDGQGGTATATLTVTVIGRNDAPIAIDDAGTTTENATVAGDVTPGTSGQDNDIDGGTLTVAAVGGMAANVGAGVPGSGGGTFTLNPDGTYSFNPGTAFDELRPGETRTTSVTYTITDGQGGTDTATLTVTVAGSNDAITALDSEVTGIEDTPYVFQVADFDVVDIDDGNTPAEIRVESLPVNGTLYFDGIRVELGDVITAAEIAAGRFTFEPLPNQNGPAYARFDFSVADREGELAPVVETRFNLVGDISDTGGWRYADTPTGTTLRALGHSADTFALTSTGQPLDGTGGRSRAFGDVTVAPGNTSGTASPTGDGFIGTFDTLPGSLTLVGGTQFQRDLGSAYGTTLSFDLINITGDGLGNWSNVNGDVRITAGPGAGPLAGSTLVIEAIDTAGSTARWQAFEWVGVSAAISEGANVTINGVQATRSEIEAILGDVADFRIVAESVIGSNLNGSNNNAATSERIAIDNIVIQRSASIATMTINITPVSDAPVAVADTNAGTEHQVLGGDVTPGTLAQDSDIDGDTLTVTTVTVGGTTVAAGTPITGSNGGTFAVNADGSYTFTPGQDFNGLAVGEQATTQVTYTISDGNGGTASTTLVVTITGQNDAPTADVVLNTASVDAASAIYDVSTFFSDADGTDTLSFAVSGLPAGFSIDPLSGVISGTWASDASQSDPNSDGVYQVMVTASDSSGVVARTFTWTVTNPAPVAQNDAGTTNEDTISNGDVLADNGAGLDQDDDGDSIAVSEVNGFASSIGTAIAGTNGGSFTILADGSYTFNPGEDFQDLADGATRSTSIVYTIDDGNGGTDTAVLLITVTGVDDAPDATDPIPNRNGSDSQTITDLDLGVLFTDREGQDIDFVISGLPDGLGFDPETGVISGTIDNNASTSGPSGNGVFTVTVLATDTDGNTTTRTFTWSVVNTFPVANADVASVNEDGSVDIDVLANDIDADGDQIVVYDGTDPFTGPGHPVTGLDIPSALNGTVTVNLDGTLHYVPNPQFSGTDLITYTIIDEDGGFSTTTVLVTVNPVADAPVGAAIAAQTNLDSDPVDLIVMDRFSDADGETLTFSLVGTEGVDYPAGLAIDANTGRITGPLDSSASTGGPLGNGVYTVVVRATDPTNRSADISVPWTVANPAPVAADDVRIGTEDAVVTGNAITGVAVGTGTDTDPDGDALTVTARTNAAGSNGGTFTIGTNGDYTFNPGTAFQDLGPGESRTTEVTYTLTDTDGATATAVIRVTVTGINDAPTVSGSVMAQTAFDAETITTLDVSGVFGDVESDLLTYSATGLPLGLAIDPNTGEITGTIDNDASGPTGTQDYSVTITALDANGARVTTTFNWTVTNPALTARNDALTTGENAIASGSVFANNGAGVDIDPDGDAFTVVAVTTGGTVNLPGDSVSGTAGGQFVINANGTFTFDPGTDFDSLPLGSSATTTVTYTIRDANGSESTATVTVTVNGANDDPAAVGTLPNLVNDDGDLVDVDVSGSFADPDGATVFTYALIGTAGVNYPAGLSILNGHIVGTIDRDASQNGPYRVTVQADDGAGSVITQTFTWVVDNPAPVAIDDTGATSENSAIVGADLTPATVGQDSDPDGDLLTVTEVNGIGFTGSTAVVGSGGGTFTINANGTYDFAPGTAFETLAQGVTRTTGVTYTISDGNGGTDTATVTVTVTGVNDAPVSAPIGAQNGLDNDTVNLDLAGRFSDVDGDTLMFSLAGTPGIDYPAGLVISTAGVITGSIDGQASQGGNTGTPGVYSVTVTVDDGNGGTRSETFTWVVRNPGPDAVADTGTVAENASITPLANLLGNDADPDINSPTNTDGDRLTVTDVDGIPFTGSTTAGGSMGGIFTITSDGSLSFDPDGAFEDLAVGEERVTTVTYTISDGNGGVDTATVEVTVVGSNDAPESTALSAQTGLDAGTVAVDVRSSFSDIDGDTLTFVASGLPPGLAIDPVTGEITGTISNNASGPTGTGVYSVEVTATDEHGQTTIQTFTWTVTNPLPASTTLPGVTSNDGEPITVDVSGNFTDSDSDPLTYSSAGLPPGLSIDPVSGIIGGTIDKAASVGGPYTVTITARDPNGGVTTQSFVWDILNPAPVAQGDVIMTAENTPDTGNVLVANGIGPDLDPDGDQLTVTEVNGVPANVGAPVEGTTGGQFTILSDGSYTFTPGSQFNDLAVGETRITSITYTISDGEGGTSTATVRVTVTGGNDAPEADPIPAQSGTDGSPNIVALSPFYSDVDGDTLAFSATGLPPGLTIDPVTGLVTGTVDRNASANGPYSVNVTAIDGHGGSVTRSIVWNISNPPPVANDDNLTTPEDQILTGSILADNGTGNDQDTDGDAIAVSEVNGLPAGVGQPIMGTTGGTFVIRADGTYSFDPGDAFDSLKAGETRVTTVSYTLRDANGGVATATVQVAVTGVNDPPVIAPIVPPPTTDSSTVDFDLTLFVTDRDGDALSYGATGLPPGLSIDPNTGRITGTIDREISQGGPYIVTVTVDDGNGGLVTQTFDWPVTNPAPIALDDRAATTEDAPVTFDVLGNDRDPDGDPLTVTTATARNGTVTINADGTLSYTPNRSFTGTDQIAYTISDGNGGIATAYVTVVVEPRQIVLLGDVFGFDGPERPRTLAPNSGVFEPITADGAVIDAVFEFGGLSSIAASLSVEGVVLSATNGIRGLGGIGSFSDGRGSIIGATLSAERIHELGSVVRFDRGNNGFDIDGLTGFSLRSEIRGNLQGLGHQEQLVIESLVRGRTLILQISNTVGLGARQIVEYRVTLPNGQPLPKWLESAGPDLLLGERPANIETLELRVEGIYNDGGRVIQEVTIQAVTGEIQPLKPVRQGQLSDPPALFKNQFWAAPQLTPGEVETLGRAIAR